MPRTRGDKGAPKDAEAPGKGKGEQGGESSPKPPEEGGSPGSGSPGAESRHGGHGRKNSKKGAGDPHAAATKAYSPFLNTVFGKVRAGAGGPWVEGQGGGLGMLGMGHGAGLGALSPPSLYGTQRGHRGVGVLGRVSGRAGHRGAQGPAAMVLPQGQPGAGQPPASENPVRDWGRGSQVGVGEGDSRGTWGGGQAGLCLQSV